MLDRGGGDNARPRAATRGRAIFPSRYGRPLPYSRGFDRCSLELSERLPWQGPRHLVASSASRTTMAAFLFLPATASLRFAVGQLQLRTELSLSRVASILGPLRHVARARLLQLVIDGVGVAVAAPKHASGERARRPDISPEVRFSNGKKPLTERSRFHFLPSTAIGGILPSWRGFRTGHTTLLER
jgi:hypothetical protein